MKINLKNWKTKIQFENKEIEIKFEIQNKSNVWHISLKQNSKMKNKNEVWKKRERFETRNKWK